VPERRHPEKLAARRLAQRPEPSREFSLALHDRLRDLDAAARRPAQLWVLVAVYACCGVVLLGLALAGALGSGPLG
jgi:hypothetical protein